MTKLIWVGLGIPLAMLLGLTTLRVIQHDAVFGPVALTAAGLYIVAASPVCAWLNAKGFSAPRVPGYLFGLLGFFGLSMLVRGLELVQGTAALLVMAMGTGALVAALGLSFRSRTGASGGDLVAAAGTETAAGKERSTTLDAEPGGLE
jgi:hypothetical protein